MIKLWYMYWYFFVVSRVFTPELPVYVRQIRAVISYSKITGQRLSRPDSTVLYQGSSHSTSMTCKPHIMMLKKNCFTASLLHPRKCKIFRCSFFEMMTSVILSVASLFRIVITCKRQAQSFLMAAWYLFKVGCHRTCLETLHV